MDKIHRILTIFDVMAEKYRQHPVFPGYTSMIRRAALENSPRNFRFTREYINVPRRSDCTKGVSRRIFKWCEIVGCPIGKCFTMSQTHTAPRFAASKFKIRIRVGSASALNHPAYSRARPRLSFGPASVLQHSPLPFAQSVVQFFFCAIESLASQLLLSFEPTLFIDKHQ